MGGEHPTAFDGALCLWICPSVLEHGQEAGPAPWPVAWVTLSWKHILIDKALILRGYRGPSLASYCPFRCPREGDRLLELHSSSVSGTRGEAGSPWGRATCPSPITWNRSPQSGLAAPAGSPHPRLLHLPSYNSPYFVARGLRILTGKSRDGPAHPVLVVCLTNYATHRKT